MLSGWLVFALVSTAIGAIVHLADTYLVRDNLFHSPLEPAIISGLFQSMFWIMWPFIDFSMPRDMWVACLAVGGGTLYIFSLYFYFKAVFAFGDITLITLLWNLVVALVPMIAYVFLGEELSLVQYAGVFLLFVGAASLSSFKGVGLDLFFKVFGTMFMAVSAMAVSLVCLKGVYLRTDFWNGYVLYNFGTVFGAILLYLFLLDRKTEHHLHRIVHSSFPLFVGIESVQLLGDFFSNVAESLGPVSLVVAVESLQAVFVMIFGALLFWATRRFFRKRHLASLVSLIHGLQKQSALGKVVVSLVMFLGTYLAGK